MKSLPPASFETFPRAWGRLIRPEGTAEEIRDVPPCVGQTPVRRSLHDLAEDIIPVRGAGSVRRAGNPPRQACYLSAWSKLHENPKHVAPARGQPPRTQENPYPIYSRLLRVTASAHGNPFLRIFPAHPAVGTTSYTEPHLSGPHQMQAAGTSPHTRGGR